MGKWCLHASLFLGNKDIFKNYKRFDFWHVQTADIGGTKPRKNNCCLIWKLFKFLMTLLAGLFEMRGCWHIGHRWAIVALWATCLKWDLTLANWTQMSNRCPLGYLFLSATSFPLLHQLDSKTNSHIQWNLRSPTYSYMGVKPGTQECWLLRMNQWCVLLLSHVLAICEQQRCWSVCASAQSDQHLCCSLPG